MATNSSRKAVRAKLADLLSAELISRRGIAQAVYSYQVGDFNGQSPVVVVSSGGTIRQPFTFSGMKPVYTMMVHVFVVYNTQDGAWNEANAEDALDDIEEGISAVISGNESVEGYWIELIQTNRSEASSVILSGVEYRTEIFELRLS